MRLESAAVLLLAGAFACAPQPPPPPAAVCGHPGATCGGALTCCSGLSCVSGLCACAGEGAACGAGGEACCGGLTCDPSNHCAAPCPQGAGACEPFGGACHSDHDCCAPGSCLKGSCADPAPGPTCAGDGQACTTASDCCGNPLIGTRPDCVATTGGARVCHFAQAGDPCDDAHHCAPELDCSASTHTCAAPSHFTTCTLFSTSCALGDACDPSSAGNQGEDPCLYKAAQSGLAQRAPTLACHGGHCANPLEGEPCSSNCAQVAGDPRPIGCAAFYDGSSVCLPVCQTDADCTGATEYDSQSYNPPPITNFCMKYGSFSSCQPDLCFAEGQKGLDDPSVLYKPCQDRPDTLCLPQFAGSLSTVVGYCMAVRPKATATVGQPCDAHAGREATVAVCGADAVCLGGRCAAVCDASQLGAAGTPACSGADSCISTQNVNLVADYQVGGCGRACDPFSDLDHSGCANYCGGPAARCDWIVGDPAGGQPRGYCGAALEHPVPVGQPCSPAAVDPCEAGARCLTGSDGVTRACTRLCDPTAKAGSPDACPTGSTCTAFDPLKHAGYCSAG